jgi:hypothetical protein
LKHRFVKLWKIAIRRGGYLLDSKHQKIWESVIRIIAKGELGQLEAAVRS